ncbi:hypothetical protein EJB05_32238 [Eragrostis curvula]|uniref:Uncharacterized protein n=1 Tax=Eragrostis curvula TaxID=38414 RepID=A0A5J9UH06_9POAL|nr:hypothetical protein EJB05_32238 [Eragrostis curvula]
MEKKPAVIASSCDELVLEMEKMLAATDPSVEWPRWSKPSIYRVPQWLKKMTHGAEDADEAYRPRLVSLGPFHHDDPDLLPMEEHKRRAVLHMAKRSGKPLREIFAAVEEVADELMDAYHDLDEKWRCRAERGRFLQVMVVDGCFLLEIMKGLAHKKAPDDYAPNDPVFSAQGMLSLWVGIRSDMLMIENQVPLLALYKLEAFLSGRRGIISVAQCAKDINKMVLDFMCDPLKAAKLAEGIDGLCLHPLDIFHKSFCGLHPPSRGSYVWESSVPSAVELRDAGIHLKKSKTVSVNGIEFKNGVLSLPALSIHDGTKKIFLNLMAFERLHSDTGTIATDYMIFMDNIIDSERDVALLRSKGIIKNLLSSDKDAADLYNTLSRGAVLSPYSKLQDVRRQVNAHCNNTWNKWKTYFRHAYLKNPWVFISLMAAVILLIATLLQTIYTVWGFYRPSSTS